jgi:serine protease Do
MSTKGSLRAKARLAAAAMVVCWWLMASALVSARSGLPDFTDLIENTSPAVVKINTVERARSRSQLPTPRGQQDIPELFRHLFEPRQRPQRNVQSMGSGFIVSEDGYILTNNHVIDGADDIQVRLVDRREYSAKLIGTDERSDLALLKIEETKLPTLQLADDNDVKVGQWVLAIGSPFGLDFSASVGIVSAIGRSIPSEKNENYVPFIQTDVAINPGNSGGPLFNLDGQVVGINSQIYTRSGGSIGLSFAIPVSVAREVMEQLKTKGRVDRGWLGVVIQEVDRDLAASFGLERPMGALVAQLDPTGPAARAGIEVGDVIVSFDGAEILSSGDLPHVVGLTRPGGSVPVILMRESQRLALDVTVGVLGGEHAVSAQAPAAEGGRLGLVVDALEPQLLKQWQLSGGVMVAQVLPEGVGAKAGLRRGDVIVQLGFEGVESLDDYRRVVEGLASDSLLPIRFYRRGRALFRTISIPK